jgi:hypothetical protein
MDDMPMGDMPTTEAYEPDDDESRAFVEAFPDNAWDEDKMAAFKEGIRLCFERHSAGDYGGESEKPSGKGGDPGIALLFGEPKKKR